MTDNKNEKPNGEIEGICAFHSETGTEGGYWAFQDSRCIEKNVGYGWCKKCGKWLRNQTTDTDIVGDIPGGCKDGAHEEEIGDSWSYEGLYILKDGDRLTIYSKDDPNEIVWSGTIKLRKYPPFTEDAFGMWIHADQEGVDRKIWAKWFFEEYPAALITIKKS